MGLLTKDIKSLDDLLLQALAELRYTERRIQRALPILAGKLSDDRLQDEMQKWVEASEAYMERVDDVFRLHGATPYLVESPAIDGIFISADELNDEIDSYHVLDTAIIGAVEAVAAYSLTRYQTVIGWLRQGGRVESARLLHENLSSRRRATAALQVLAERCLAEQLAHRSGRVRAVLAG